MKNWILASVAVAAIGFFALESPAQEVIKQPAPGTTITQSEPVPVQPRRGLLRRFQERRGIVRSEAPSTTTMPSTTPKVGTTPTPSTTPSVPRSTTTPMATQQQVVEPRTGVLARLRSRLGR